MLDISSYQLLINASASHYKTHPNAMSQAFGELLSNIQLTKLLVREKGASNNNQQFSIESHALLADMFNKRQHSLLEHISSISESLEWRPSGFGKLPPDITNHVAVVEIMGPDGMIQDDRFRFGLLLQDPNISYAKHQHAAEELYLILSGEAAWSVDDNEASIRTVGEFIHHEENQPHQMKTNNEPLLAMWVWMGDIDSKSYSI